MSVQSAEHEAIENQKADCDGNKAGDALVGLVRCSPIIKPSAGGCLAEQQVGVAKQQVEMMVDGWTRAGVEVVGDVAGDVYGGQDEENKR